MSDQSPGTPLRRRAYNWGLSGDLEAKMELTGEPQSEEDLEALRNYVDITIKALARTLKRSRESVNVGDLKE